MRILTTAALLGALALGGCGTFDPIDTFQDWDLLGRAKKPLQGQRQAVFPEGVPGVPQGVPPEMVKGYQPPAEAPPPVIEAKPVKPKPKRTAAAPPPRKPRPQPQPAEQQVQQVQPARTVTQPVGQSASQQTMPGAQPTW